MTSININLPNDTYRVSIGKGLLNEAGKLLKLDRKCIILTDNGVPSEYAEAVARQCRECKILTLPMGESTKSLASLEIILNEMAQMEMSRSDALVAVGGGVVGDLGGFAAAVYMRGIDFYTVPTTLLSQVDASVGGKTAINLGRLKNTVGAFHQPSGVLIDVSTLDTLSQRLFAEGLAEVIKMAMTSDAALFRYLEGASAEEIRENAEQVIYKALLIKKAIVEADEKEMGLRKILNFGHTLGHAIEASDGELFHGECVALGMCAMCEGEARERLIGLLKKVGLPFEYSGNAEKLAELTMHDKKRSGEKIDAVLVKSIGECEIKRLDKEELKKIAEAVF